METYHNLHRALCRPAEENIDTDQIIPARFLKTTVHQGRDRRAFRHRRRRADGQLAATSGGIWCRRE